jgi:hypothetical protein
MDFSIEKVVIDSNLHHKILRPYYPTKLKDFHRHIHHSIDLHPNNIHLHLAHHPIYSTSWLTLFIFLILA